MRLVEAFHLLRESRGVGSRITTDEEDVRREAALLIEDRRVRLHAHARYGGEIRIVEDHAEAELVAVREEGLLRSRESAEVGDGVINTAEDDERICLAANHASG